MKKIRVLLVSLLKPVNDTRMYEKMGRTLAADPRYEVHVAGFRAPVPPATSGISFHPVFSFPRLSAGRPLAQAKYLRLLYRLRPDLVIVGTHELLLASLLYKAAAGARLVYDVRENYALNLRSQGIYPKGVRQLLATLVRSQEVAAARFIDHFLLAEQSYALELPFLRKAYTVVENKVAACRPRTGWQAPVKLPGAGKPWRLLFSGTLSRLAGVFEAIFFCQQLRFLHPQAELLLIGHCPEEAVLQEIRAQIAPLPYVTLEGGNQLVPHARILEVIRHSDVGLLPYRPHPSSFACLPTKMYEYMGHGLPMVVQQNPYWKPLVTRHEAGLFLDFKDFAPAQIYAWLKETCFYPNGLPQEVLWDNEAPAFLAAIEKAWSVKPGS